MRTLPAPEIRDGMVFDAPYPFVRDTYESFEEDGPVEVKTWKPGVRFEDISPEDVEAVADGMGQISLTVVSVVKPGRYPARVFFTRRWVSPDGRAFGKDGLRMTTVPAFRKLANGYRHKYRLASEAEAS